jgi:hypothetical protein
MTPRIGKWYARALTAPRLTAVTAGRLVRQEAVAWVIIPPRIDVFKTFWHDAGAGLGKGAA